MRDSLARFDHLKEFQPQVPTRECGHCFVMRPIGCTFENACSLNHAPEKSLELRELDEELDIIAVSLVACVGGHERHSNISLN